MLWSPALVVIRKEEKKERKSALLQTTKKLSAAISRKEEKMYKQEYCTRAASTEEQACKLKLRLRELTSCLCSAAASAVCFEGHMAGLDATETGKELSQPQFEFTSLPKRHHSRHRQRGKFETSDQQSKQRIM